MKRLLLLNLIFNTLILYASEPKVIANGLDLYRYQGRWYEIARFPNKFQKDCYKNAQAYYELNEKGLIEVKNMCIELDGSKKMVSGLAKVKDSHNSAKLGVSFFTVFGIRPIWPDYLVYSINNDYTVSVVGDGKGKMGWVLSRTPTININDLIDAKIVFQKNGYSLEQLKLTKQIY